MNKIFNVGIIGMGYWGPNILRVLLKNKSFNICKVVDHSKKRLQYVKKINKNISTSKNINDIIYDKKLNSVFICTPAKSHFKITRECLKTKKNVFVEKPIALSLKQVNKLFLLSKKRKLILMSGDQYIYHPAIKIIKKIINKKNFGKIFFINSERLNLGRIRSDIDVKLNFSTHDIGIIQYLLNYEKPQLIQNSDLKILNKKKSDLSFIKLKYKNNIYVNIYVSWLHPEKVRKLLIIGSKKMLIYDDLKPGIIKLIDKFTIPFHKKLKLDFDKKFIPNSSYIEKKSKLIKFKVKEPLQIEINHFLSCLKKKNNLSNLTGEYHCKNIFGIIDKFKN